MTETPETETADNHDTATPKLGPVRTPRRRPKLDPTLAEAVETARSALKEIVEDRELGDHVSAAAEDDRLVTHRFTAHVRGYRGWEWFCTLARAPRSKVITVCELGMLPGDDALLSPPWVPWAERASDEERLRLDAIAEGKDPKKAVAELKNSEEAEGTERAASSESSESSENPEDSAGEPEESGKSDKSDKSDESDKPSQKPKKKKTKKKAKAQQTQQTQQQQAPTED